MTENIEYIGYAERDRLAMLESRAADLERRLLAVAPAVAAGGEAGMTTGAVAGGAAAWDPATAPVPDGLPNGYLPPGYADASPGDGEAGGPPAYGGHDPAPGRAGGADGRTEELISRGRHSAAGTRWRWPRGRWRIAAAAAGAASLLVFAFTLVIPGGDASWPASVARVRAQIAMACQNGNVAAEPSQVNFACAKDTQQVLWVFSLLTSGNNPSFSDPATGRKGLEPIQPSQGGAIAWSLNLHHPYNPASPVDSLQVAARAINNIIGGATLTSPSGAPVVQPGLESSAANCQRYTGSPQLVARAGFPARCAHQVASPAGRAALVSDVFTRWMNGTPPQVAAQAGVLFTNADNPGDPRVQAILAALPAAGL